MRAVRKQHRVSLDLETLFWATTAQSRQRPPLAPGGREDWRPANARSFVARPVHATRFRIDELR